VRPEWALEQFAQARVARLATVTPQGDPHVVPVVFVLDTGGDSPADVVWIVVDEKRKSTRRLKRLANIEAHPRVSLLVDHYDEDWERLWWVRADGRAGVHDISSRDGAAAIEALRTKYPQHAAATNLGPLIRIAIDRWTAWSATPGTT